MKIKFLIIPILLLTIACQNTSKENTEQSAETTEVVAKVNVQKIEINVEGMSCSGCENTIQETIKDFEGVYTANADHVNGVAVMEFDSTKINVADVMLAINDLGYEATEHQILAE